MLEGFLLRRLLPLLLLLLALVSLVGPVVGQVAQLGPQGVEAGEAVLLVAHEGLVEARQGAEAGGEGIHLPPPRQHLGPCPGTPL